MHTHLKKITDKARKIRKPGEKWTTAVKRAAKMVPSLSPSKKKARKSAPKKRKADYHQTGKRRSLARDKAVKAKAPGKRVVRTGGGKSHAYYERRANRSDKPGTMTGVNGAGSTYRYNVMQRITSNVRLLNEAEAKERSLKSLLSAVPRSEKADKLKIRGYIKQQREYIRQLKKDISGFKTLLR